MNLLQRLRSQYRRDPNEPPHTPGPIPWLGVALDYGRDAGAMLTALRARHFARNEIKVLVAVLLQRFDLAPIDVPLPPFVEGRAGLGIFPPAGDVPAQIVARA